MIKLKYKVENLKLLIIIYIVSRFPFLANYPFFFDSPEYLKLAQNNNFWQALKQSHNLLHPVYLFLIQKLSILIPSSKVITFVSFLAGLGSLICFYYLIKILYTKKIAFLSTLIWQFFNHLYLLQTNIMHEGLDLFLFIISLLFVVLYFQKEKKRYLFFGIVFLSLTFLNSLSMVIWLPLIGFFWLYLSNKNKEKHNLLLLTFFLLISLFLALIFSKAIIAKSLGTENTRFKALINESKQITNLLTPLGALRAVRNGIYILVYGYSPLVMMIFVYSIYKLINKKNIFALLIFGGILLNFWLANGFWYGGMYGRFVAVIGFFVALVVAFQSRLIYWTTFISGLLMTVYVQIQYLKTPIPVLQRQLIETISLKDDNLLILSDYQRPHFTDLPALFINHMNKKLVEEKINQGLNVGKRVFISFQAITFPYYQYDGQLVHILSKGNEEKAFLYSFLQDKSLSEVEKNLHYPMLTIYEVK